jgi:hypothetical protein
MIRISVKGLAKFMTAGPAAQRKVLRDFKFPDPEGGVQASYYSEARRAITEFHESENDPATIAREVESLSAKAFQASGRQQVRIEHNIRALQSYLANFGHETFVVLPTPSISLSHRSVSIGATPDLFVRHKTSNRLIKLDLGAHAPDQRLVGIILQVIYEAARSSGLSLKPTDIVYLDVPRAKAYRSARIRTRLKSEIEAACQNIEALWPTIK